MTDSKEMTKELAVTICKHVAAGMSQRQACAKENVCESTFRYWKDERPEILAHYTRAREERANGWAEELVEIADSIDINGDPMEVRNRIAKAEKMLDARKWTISRIVKDYRDKQESIHSGAVDVGAMTEEEIRRRFQALMDKQ